MSLTSAPIKGAYSLPEEGWNSSEPVLAWEFWPRDGWEQCPHARGGEPVQWRDATTDLACLMHRNHAGSWCGYVAVEEGHPLFGVDCDTAHVRYTDLTDGYLKCPHARGGEPVSPPWTVRYPSMSPRTWG